MLYKKVLLPCLLLLCSTVSLEARGKGHGKKHERPEHHGEGIGKGNKKPQGAPFGAKGLSVYKVTGSDKNSTQFLYSFGRGGASSMVQTSSGIMIAFDNFNTTKKDTANFGKIAVSFSSDSGSTWSTPLTATINNLPADLMARRPTLVNNNGIVTMYFTGVINRTSKIYSATWAGSNIFDYQGTTFAVDDMHVADSAAASDGPVTYMIVSGGKVHKGKGRGGKIFGRKLLGGRGRDASAFFTNSNNFNAYTNATLPQRGGAWIGNMVADGGNILFFGSGKGPWPVVSSGSSWTTAASAGVPEVFVPGADPGVVPLGGNTWLFSVNGRGRID